LVTEVPDQNLVKKAALSFVIKVFYQDTIYQSNVSSYQGNVSSYQGNGLTYQGSA